MENREYDVIIIGSGMGALTTGSLLAQFSDKKVLLLEQHFKAGGFTHVFKREGKFLWDVGIHYVGDMESGSALRKVFDLVTAGKVRWAAMPDVFEKFVYPDFTFSVRNDPSIYENDLIESFPEEKEAIRRYFHDIKKVASWHGRHMMLKALPPFLDTFGAALDLIGSSSALVTTGEYLDKNFRNQKLKAVLCSQWGDYGLPPKISSFAIHALIVSHYLKGGFYPIGGSGQIAQAVQDILKAHGGRIALSREVKEILVDNGKAIGVRVLNKRKTEEEGKEIEEIYYAPQIVSDAGAYNTFLNLLPTSVKLPYRQELESFSKVFPLTTNVTLYLGLKEDPRRLGFQGENHWIYSSYDHDKNFSEGYKWTEGGRIPGVYLSFPSLKDPEAHAHTAEIIAFCDYKAFEFWKDQPWKERNETYKAKKAELIRRLLDYVEEKYEGFKDLVEYTELSTPITTEHFTLHRKGTIYGLPCVPDRFREVKSPWFSPKTPIENLTLTGADAASPGLSGAMMGGFSAFANMSGGMTVLQLFRKTMNS
ncbi:NAD(P)-binding Rossmann-like domain protein [Leptospira fainei serovar Hurstbridge str. BUT 6]|uniref:NAD(P)-binding Rossmann-like domain protein n=1 Tax=Leptospira fainei serovar Hurstbridge str. BUT 6 TaxID=1193011 RepID=S3UT29_9LEPT|nr:NAD(P)/FAD-dependent oxidoreductase [Leptospira fainei]EPG72433.1 NAD(P)-binding Rossmann-like domain protein [Leptospira fainei serovar Hurstbridge str. BUT 6]